MANRDSSTSWLAQADADLEAARANAAQERHALACFLAHETAAKSVKGFLYSKGAEMVWGDHLSDLCEDAMAFDPSFDFVKSVGALLDKHALGARNPDAVGGAVPAQLYDATDSGHAIEIADEVLEAVRQKILGG
ncbi:MAG: HEPN domain-containing protein [Chloroflexi bacterium]|nr:HEPN domain-containing protein [Chloroflexota bacterium]